MLTTSNAGFLLSCIAIFAVAIIPTKQPTTFFGYCNAEIINKQKIENIKIIWRNRLIQCGFAAIAIAGNVLQLMGVHAH